MNKRINSQLTNEKGSILIVVVIVLLAVTVIGILASRTAFIEQRITSHDKTHKMTWFATDGNVQMTTELIEQNIEERGFGPTEPVAWGNGPVTVFSSEFWKNEESSVCSDNLPTTTNRDVQDSHLGQSTTYIKVYGNRRLSTGNALQISAGDKGRGKGAAGGGAYIIYDIRGLGIGPDNSQAKILQRWRHVI